MLTASVEKKLGENKEIFVEQINGAVQQFSEQFREHVDKDVEDLKLMGEMEYNFDQMLA
jgi:hypothetical protein